MLVTLIIILCLLAFGFFYYRKTAGRKLIIQKNAIHDPAAQALYNKNKHKDEEKKLSFKERLELSWKFLNQITETIINKFSQEDQEIIKETGKTLIKHGMKYEHVIELAMQQVKTQVKNVAVEPDKSQPEIRGR